MEENDDMIMLDSLSESESGTSESKIEDNFLNTKFNRNSVNDEQEQFNNKIIQSFKSK